MRQNQPETLILGLASIFAVGCHQQPPSAPAQESSQPSTPAAIPGKSATPALAETASTKPPAKHPYRYDEPPVEQNDTAGVRGTQTVDFAVSSAGKPAQGAEIRITNRRGKLEGEGKSDDWGEFHTALSPGSYTVSTAWQGKSATRPITIDASTQRIPLSVTPLDTSNP